MGNEIFQLALIRDQFCKEMPKIPFEQHFANIKDHIGYFRHILHLFARRTQAESRRKKTARESDSERHFVRAIRLQCAGRVKLTLARLKAWLGLVDDIRAATAANHAVIAMAALERLQRINDFHRIYPSF